MNSLRLNFVAVKVLDIFQNWFFGGDFCVCLYGRRFRNVAKIVITDAPAATFFGYHFLFAIIDFTVIAVLSVVAIGVAVLEPLVGLKFGYCFW